MKYHIKIKFFGFFSSFLCSRVFIFLLTKSLCNHVTVSRMQKDDYYYYSLLRYVFRADSDVAKQKLRQTHTSMRVRCNLRGCESQ